MRALVLGPGGAAGSFQAGVLHYLFQNGHHQGHDHFDYIVGDSVGALNGVLLSAKGVPGVVQLWQSIDRSDVYSLPTPIEAWQILRGTRRGFFSPDPLRRMITRLLKGHRLKIPVSYSTVSLQTGKERVLIDEMRPEYLLAASAIPIAWEPVRLDGEDYVDGAIRNLSPIGRAIDKDPDEIVVINCRAREMRETLSFPFIKVVSRSFDIMLNALLNADIKTFTAVNDMVEQAQAQGITLFKKNGRPYRHYRMLLVEPCIDLGSTLDFTPSTLERNFIHGYERAHEMFDLEKRRIVPPSLSAA